MSKREQWGHKRCTWQPTNWHTYKGFRRNKGEGEWIRDLRHRKDRYASVTEGLSDHLDFVEDMWEDESNDKEGCMWCCYDY